MGGPISQTSYLFALVAGDFDTRDGSFITASGREINLRIYVEKGYRDQTEYAMQC